MARSRAGDRERNRPTRWRRFLNALHSNQNFEYLYWLQIGLGVCFDWTMRLIGPLLLLFATGLISMVIAMYFRFILPASAAVGSIAYLMHATWAIFLAFNVFFNYFHCAFTHPGNPTSFLPQSAMAMEDSEDEVTEDDDIMEATSRPLIAEGSGISRVNVGGNSVGGYNSGTNPDAVGAGERGRASAAGISSRGNVSGTAAAGGAARLRCGYCKKCRQPKPARAHHCHVCDQCIVNMDHHCPWMNNCVGFLNYRYFVLFLLYMFVGCFYAVLVTAPHFLSFAKASGLRRRSSSVVEAKRQSAVMMTFVLALSVGIAISILLFWHLYLICTAQTTIEFYQNQTNRSRAKQWGELWTNPFDVGMKGNWQQVFGSRPFLLGLLPSRRAPPSPIVEFFPVEELDHRQRFQDEGEWTLDGPMNANHIV